MHELAIIDRTGDTKLRWAPDKPAGDGADLTSVEEVRAKFKQVIDQGYMAYTVDDAGNCQTTRTFDETAPQIVMAPPLVGG